MEALKRYINYYINEYSNKFYEYKKNLDLLDEYKYDFDTFLSYNFTTYLKIFYVGTSKYAFDKYEELVDLYQEYFDLIEEYDYIGLKELLEKIDEIVKKDNLKDYIIKGFSYKEKFNNFNKLDFNSNLITFLSLTFNDDSGKMDFEAYNTFLKEFLNKKALSLFFAIVEIYKVKNVIKEMETIEGRKKDKQKVLESYTTRLNRIIDLIRGYRFKFEVEYKELEKEKKKYISILKDLERDLESGKPIDLEKYKKLIDNDKIITEIVLYNNRFQNAAYKEVKEEKEELNKTDLSKFESELLQNNINLDITKISIEIDLAKKKLSLLSKTKELIKYNNVLLYFINNISIETIKTIITMIVEKDITEEFVLENIFNLEEDKINNFINNIKLS